MVILYIQQNSNINNKGIKIINKKEKKKRMEKEKIISGAVAFSLLLFLVLSASLASAEQLTPPLPGAPNYIDIGVEKAHEMLEGSPEEIILLDVRTEGEYSGEYIPGAVNIPLSDLENRIGELDKSKVIVYCQSGGRSGTASETLAQHGFAVYNMIEGINAWKEKFATSSATPTVTPTLPPAVTTATPSPAASPSLTPTPAPTLTPMPGEKRGIPGFEAVFAIAALLVISFHIFRRREREDKK